MNKFTVIGSNSFTGSHIIDALLEEPGRQVVGISRSPEYKDFFLPYKTRATGTFAFHQIDLVNEFEKLAELLEEVRPQVVINVAAQTEVALSHERPTEYFQTNTLSVVRLCDFLRTRPWLERYVHISSAEVFGLCDDPATEKTPFAPTTPYAVSKAAADMHLETLITHYGFPATIIRSTNVYGKHQQLFKIIPRSVIYLKLGKTIGLHGGGTAVKSFVHIRDVVRGVISAIEKDRLGTYHFSSPNNLTIAETVRLVCELMGSDFEERTQPSGDRQTQDARYWLDFSKSVSELSWSPMETFEDAVLEVIAWIEDNWEAVLREPLVYVHKS